MLAQDPFVDELLNLLRERSPEEVEVDRSQLTGNTQAAREQLAQFDVRLQEIRAAITRGNVWIERYFIHKPGWRPEVIQLAYAFWQEAKAGVPVPRSCWPVSTPRSWNACATTNPFPDDSRKRRGKKCPTVRTINTAGERAATARSTPSAWDASPMKSCVLSLLFGEAIIPCEIAGAEPLCQLEFKHPLLTSVASSWVL